MDYRLQVVRASLLFLVFGCAHCTNSTEKTDQCQLYKGAYCQNILNQTDLRFINVSLGVNRTEFLAVELGKQIDIIFKSSKRNNCQPLMIRVICFYLFPMCDKNGKKVQYCRKDCRYIFQICGDELNKLVGAGKALLDGKISGDIFRFDECDQDLQTDNDEECVHLPFLEIPPEEEDEGGPNLTLVIILCVVAPIIIVLIGVLVYLQFKNRKLRAHSIHYEKEGSFVNKDRLSNIVSMRDRIREWKLAPSEMLELVEICQKRGVNEIPVDSIDYLKDLGSGQYGLVFQGKVNQHIEGEESRIVAVKTLREGSSPDAIKEFCQEVNIMSTFSHPHVVKLIGVSLADEPYCMIFEFVEFGDLASFLRNCAEVKDDSTSSYPKITVTDQLAMALQVGSAMKYISSIRCIHRDLAARNCLVGRGLVVKISDFGLSRDVYASEYYRMEKTRMLPVRWLPPEAFADGKFTVYSDIYAYGVLLWEIFTFAKLPYEDYDNTRTMELILDGQILEKPEQCPDAVYDIMKECWLANAEERILFPDIINELCSLDDFGQRFHASEEQVVENYSRRIPAGASAVSYHNATDSLSYEDRSLILDEAPINVERLPVPERNQQENCHYSTPKMKRNVLPKDDNIVARKDYDGVIAVPANTAGQHTKPDCEAYMNYPAPPLEDDRSSSTSELIPDEPQETYDIPPVPLKRQQSKESGINVDSEEGEEPQEVYDIPPPQEDEETYHVPAKSQLSPPDPEGYGDEPQETYDVPPKSPECPQEIYQCPSKSLQRQFSHGGVSEDDDGPQETYDVPPKLDVPPSDEIYQNPTAKKNGLYSVPQSPYLQRRTNETDQVRSASLETHSYENVGFDGKPLLSATDE